MFTTTHSSMQNSLRWLRRAMTLILLISSLATTVLAGATSVKADTQPSFPIRAVFYYPWFPEAWNQQGFNPFTNYTPSLGFYDGSNATVIKQHIAAMQYGGIQVGIASWWGQGTKTDGRISALLQGAAGTNFRWSVYYEQESQGNPTVTQLTNDLTYLRDKYGNDPSFLRIGGRFVVFVYADGSDACAMVDRWKQANTVGAYLVLKVFSGYRNCTNQPDGWHQYSPAVAADSQKGYSYAIAPGFWKKGEAVRLARDLTRWNQNIRDMIASGAPFQLVTTFNEWGEGTSVESAQEWASSSGYGAYLDALHSNGNSAPTQPTATTIPPTQTKQPTSTTIPPTQTTQPTATAALPTQTSIATNTQAPTLPGPTATAAATRTQAPNLPPPTQTPLGTSIPAATATQSSTSGTLTFGPAADAYVTSAIPNTNYGGSQQIRFDASPVVKGYLTFNVQGLSGAVSSAKLKIYANSSSTAGCKAYAVPDTSWGERSITYNNAPALGNQVGSSGAFAGAVWVTMDVTPLVAGNGVFSLALTGINGTAVSLASRETGAHSPQLIIKTLASGVPAPTQTAPPANTPIASPTNAPTQVFTTTPAPTKTTNPTSLPTQTLAATATKTATVAPSSVPSSSAIQHVFVVVMENHSYNEVWNTSSSPYITSLGNSFARATNYHATTHPSLPNYLDLYGGSHYGITTDCNPSTSCHVNATNLADNLEAKGLTWKGYMEAMPSPCYLTTSGKYAPKHNPMVYFDDIRNNATRCTGHDVPYSALAGDLASKSTTPSYALIVPDLCNDMHDCSVSTGDTWLKNNLPAILNSPACTVDKCLLILTWDEDDSSQSNQVLTIFAGSAAKTGGVTSGVSYTHFSLLRTVENIFGLPTQTSNDAAASPMNDLLR
ncbi:MAG TPA: alkaline phosphatase family protein [Anaerolineales bacterium]|nr:alkaline phosphatase family protein [Anaerolineales bacterium]